MTIKIIICSNQKEKTENRTNQETKQNQILDLKSNWKNRYILKVGSVFRITEKSSIYSADCGLYLMGDI